MSYESNVNREIIDRQRLPPLFPTHKHSAEFWEALGRAIGTYGFLEEILGKAIFAFTATRRYTPEEVVAAYEVWLPQLERALKDPLRNLTDAYAKAVRNNPDATITNIDELVAKLEEAAVIRNVLCHGSWRTPNADGASVPLFVDKHMRVFETAIDVSYLRQTQSAVADLVCAVIDTVTHMGRQFPGGGGSGKPIFVKP
jgi:hypothetical protein